MNKSSSIAFWPGVSVGYTIGGGIDFGVDIGATVLNYTVADQNCALGANISFDMFRNISFISKTGKGWYRLYCFNFLNTINDNFMFKIGGGKIWTRWGDNNINISKRPLWGLNTDISYDPMNNGLFFGFHRCKVKTPCVGLIKNTTTILYSSYKYPIRFLDYRF